MKLNFNYASLVTLPVSIWLCYSDRVSWWTFLMIMLLITNIKENR